MTPSEFKRIRRKNRTYDMCLEAVKQDGMFNCLVNKEFHTEELCLEAVKQKCQFIL